MQRPPAVRPRVAFFFGNTLRCPTGAPSPRAWWPDSVRSDFAVDDDGRARLGVGDQVAADRLAVDGQFGCRAFAAVLHVDAVLGAAALAGDGELADLTAHAGMHAQAVEVGAHPQEVLGDSHEIPGRSPRQPGVLGLAVANGVLAGVHLGVDVRLEAVDLALLLEVRRRDLLPVVEGAIAAADHRLGDDHPGVVVAEDAGVLLVPRRVRGDLP